MESKRNKQWRRKQGFRVFKQRIVRQAAWTHDWVMEDGTRVERPHWTELASTRWAQVYRSTGTPCSCPLCQGERYSRLGYKKETARILRESYE